MINENLYRDVVITEKINFNSITPLAMLDLNIVLSTRCRPMANNARSRVNKHARLSRPTCKDKHGMALTLKRRLLDLKYVT